MLSRHLNARAANLDFALLTQPSSSDFQLNSHFASITLPIGCYAGPNVWACSRPLNSRALRPRHISACSDDSASAMVDGVGRSLAGAVGRSASGFRQCMLSKCLVKRLAGGQSLRQCGMGHQTHAVVGVPHRARFASRATRQTHVRLLPQFPNNAIGNWCWGVW